MSNTSGAQDRSDYIEEMEQKRKSIVESLWQSEREPIQVEDTVYLDFFPISEKYRVPCFLVEKREAKPFEMATYSGQLQTYIIFGTAIMEIDGYAFSLELYQNYDRLKKGELTDYLFLPFKDATNSEETYGGGRYLNMSISEIRNKGCFVDFNLAYNPWCAYREGFNCPIPPRANHLDLKIKAGEKNFGKDGVIE